MGGSYVTSPQEGEIHDAIHNNDCHFSNTILTPVVLEAEPKMWLVVLTGKIVRGNLYKHVPGPQL